MEMGIVVKIHVPIHILEVTPLLYSLLKKGGSELHGCISVCPAPLRKLFSSNVTAQHSLHVTSSSNIKEKRNAVDEQLARQQLVLHWFMTAYMAVYIQGLYSTQCTTVLEYSVLLRCWNWLGT
jgi:hypothetical protein